LEALTIWPPEIVRSRDRLITSAETVTKIRTTSMT
jgi:hypothetical protein